MIFEKYLKRLWIAKREQIIEASKKLDFDIEHIQNDSITRFQIIQTLKKDQKTMKATADE